MSAALDRRRKSAVQVLKHSSPILSSTDIHVDVLCVCVWYLIWDLNLYVVLKLVSFALDTVAGFDVVLSTKKEKKKLLSGHAFIRSHPWAIYKCHGYRPARLMIFTCRKQCKENRICSAPTSLAQEFQEVIVLHETVCAGLDCR